MFDGVVVLKAALVACLLDAACGYPQALFSRIGHPVSWAGRLISLLEVTLNRRDSSGLCRRFSGCMTLLLLILVGGSISALIQVWIMRFLGGAAQWCALGACAAPFLAWKSLRDHVSAVSDALINASLDHGRTTVARIVGRDVKNLSEGGVSRAAIESLAENFSDAVVAPLFWFLIAGLPGLVIYKCINTADSMLGHLTPELAAFGRASALTDDVVNGVPARLTALFIAVSCGSWFGFRRACRAALLEGPRHRSFNAGWPEGAMAGALDVSLAGPRHYDGVVAQDVVLNPQGREPCATDIAAALQICRNMFVLLLLIAVILLYAVSQ